MVASSVPIPTIDEFGFNMPAFADVLSSHQADYLGIYGSDVVITSDTQDGEWIAIEATAMYDTFSLCLAVYNSFSPTTAQGVGLSSVVKVNGITREVASYSTCDVTIVGQAGVTITNGQVRDESQNLWSLPTSVLIPLSGTITVTATCLVLGAVTAAAGQIDQIATPTQGWQTVSNAGPATPGAPVEKDPELRVRQSQSTMLPSQNVLDGIIGAIAAIPGVARIRGYENDTNTTDGNGIPGHSISLVVDGGDSTAIATVIANKKTGGGTYGTVPVIVISPQGIPRTIAFFRPTEPPITYTIGVTAFTGFTTGVQALIQQAVSDWTNALGIGAGRTGKIMIPRVYGPAELIGTSVYDTFEITSIQAARDGGSVSSSDITIAFNEAPFCLPSYVTLVVST